MAISEEPSNRKTATSSSSFQLSRDDIRRQIIEELANVRITDIDDLQREIIQGEGDIEISSLQGASIIGALEGKWGYELPGIESLPPTDYVSVEKLVNLIENALRTAHYIE